MPEYPTRRKLPVSYSTEIGRIVTRWAYLEWRLKDIAYLLLNLGPQEGRIAVREPRVGDYLTMLQDLCALRKVNANVNWAQLKKTLRELGEFRDKLSHGIWLNHENSKTPVLQVTSGSYPPWPGAKTVKARISPQGVEVTLKNLRDIRHAIDQFTGLIEYMHRNVEAAIAQ